uniref:Uncharacterized protein n=1 Tax=Arundo donax TaxID=35708 RepID=A0A0A8Z5T2_ARUDO
MVLKFKVDSQSMIELNDLLTIFSTNSS